MEVKSKERKSEQLIVRVTPSTMVDIETYAERHGCTKTDVVEVSPSFQNTGPF